MIIYLKYFLNKVRSTNKISNYKGNKINCKYINQEQKYMFTLI